MKIYELMPTNGRKSFYGKAQVVVDEDGVETLKSYGTDILKRYSDGRLKRVHDGWTLTTGNHIRSFCGLDKKEFLSLPLNEKV